MLKLGKRAGGHFVTLIEICVHLITPGQYIQYEQSYIQPRSQGSLLLFPWSRGRVGENPGNEVVIHSLLHISLGGGGIPLHLLPAFPISLLLIMAGYYTFTSHLIEM